MGNIVSGWVPTSYYVKGNLTDPTDAATVSMDASQDAATLPPAQASIFKTLVDNSTELGPQDGKPPSDIQGTLERYEKLSEDLANFQSLAQDPTELVSLLVSVINMEQQAAVNQEMNQSEAMIADDLAQAQDDRNGATALMNAAASSLAMSVVGGVVQVAGAGAGIYGSVRGLSALRGMLDDGSKLDGAGDKVIETPKSVAEPEAPRAPPVVRTDPLDGVPRLGGSDGDGDGDSNVNVIVDVDVDDPSAAPTNDTPTLDGTDPDNDSSPVVKNPIADAGDALAARQEHDIKMEKVKQGGLKWQAISQLITAVGQSFGQGGNYYSTYGTAQNDTWTANGQEDAANAAEAQQFYTYSSGVVTSLHGTSDSLHQALSGWLNAKAGISGAIANNHASI